MNWYKISKVAQSLSEEDLENVDFLMDAIRILKQLNISHKVISDFPNADPIIVFGDKVWDNGSVEDKLSWIYNINDWDLDKYINVQKNDFWQEVSDGVVAYHATSEDNLDSILSEGLQPDCKTRAISNKSMPCAVFASMSLDYVEPYGTVIFAIDVSQMKRDGYMPEVSGEEPLEEAESRNALANKIGLEYYDFSEGYASEGLSEDTIAFYGPIPVKYLKHIKE